MTTPSEWKRALPWLLVIGSIFLLLYLLGDILTPFVMGAALAYLCDPLVGWLQRHRIGRAWGSLLATVLICGAVIAIVLLVLPLVWREAQLLAEKMPGLIDVVQDRLLPWLAANFGVNLSLDAATLRAWAVEHWSKAGGLLTMVMSRISAGGSAALGLAATLFLVPVVTFYMLLDWPRLLRTVDELIPRPIHAKSMKMIHEMDAVLAEFVRGQLMVMFILAVYYSTGLWIAGVDFALPVGILTGLLVFIPYVGFGLGLILAILVAILQFDGWGPLIGVAVVYALGQVIESFYLTPRIVGERIGLHPLGVIFMLMAFGHLFGFAGVLVALPVCAAGAVAMREARQHYLSSRWYRGEGA